MSKFIELTDSAERKTFMVNTESIIKVSKTESGKCFIKMSDNNRVPVEETYEEVREMLGCISGLEGLR